MYTFNWRDRVFGNIALHAQQMHCPCATLLTADPATSETERTTHAGSMHHGRIFDNSEENMSPVRRYKYIIARVMTKTLGICGPLEWIMGQRRKDWLMREECIGVECFGKWAPDRDRGSLD